MRPIVRRCSSGMRSREPMSYVPPGVIRKYGLVAPSGAMTRTATSNTMLSRSRVKALESYPEQPVTSSERLADVRRARGIRSRQDAVRELNRMKEHHAQTSGAGGRLRAAIFGINDGLVTNASLVVGVAAAEPGRHVVILAGIAGLVAGAFSMAAGEYISMSVQRELFESEIALERRELETDPEGERHEVAVMFRAKGLDEEDAERIADRVM